MASDVKGRKETQKRGKDSVIGLFFDLKNPIFLRIIAPFYG
jgi:hypothetical protein